jgi:hypothetical protein
MTVLRTGFTSSIRYVSIMKRHSTLRSRYYGCGHLLLINALSLVDDIDDDHLVAFTASATAEESL